MDFQRAIQKGCSGNRAGRAVARANRKSKEYKGNQKTNISDAGKLKAGKTYYWRIDAVLGAKTITGDVWSFTIE